MPGKRVQQILEEHAGGWMAIAGVVGVAIGELEGEPCVRILVEKKTDDLMKRIPSEVEGFPVVVNETGEIRALQ
ncbi:MAG: hypothetical protein J7M08_02585 [Planctomycetes bacterium]|nr:hypothetical protein [Planctomycetota bacterium]